MNKLTFILAAMVLVGLLPATACQTNGGETHTPIPVKDMGILWSEQEAPDDIMPVPGGGPAYRANVHQQGVENPWPSIEVSEVFLGSGSNEAHIYYRNYIETAAGEKRNNVVKVIIPGKDVNSLSLYADDIPPGITLTDGLQWSGPSAKASVLVIEISPDVMPGEYILEIGLEINGKDYGTIPCTIEVVESTIEKSMVQVFETGEPAVPVAFGIVVGDGNQVLTVLDYEDYTPASDSLDVVASTNDRFSASIQAIDPRTSATLLHIEGADLPAVKTGDSAALEQGQRVFIQGWQHLSVLFKKVPATASYPSDWPLAFQVSVNLKETGNEGWANDRGAAITDEDGNVLGLAGAYYNKLLPIPGRPDVIPQCVPINSALELLAPDAASRAWADGPVATTLLAGGRATVFLSGILPSLSAYEQTTETIQELLGTLGRPLDDDDELAQHYVIFISPPPEDGILLTVTYARLQELRSPDGELLARAKWVGIQWNRSEGKPNRLFYGIKPYDLEGIFELTGDTGDLEKALQL